MAPNHRDISPFLKLVRDFFLGRKHITHHRYADTLSSRSMPPPSIPEGPGTRLFGNQYFLRDPRRQVRPPIDLVEQKKQDAKKAAKVAEAAKNAPKASPKAKPTGPTKASASSQPKKSEGKAAKDCTSKQQKGTPSLPTPGRLHNWD